MQGEEHTGPGPYLCPQEGKGRAVPQEGWNYTFNFQPDYRGKEMSLLPTVLENAPKGASITSVLSSPFCIPSSTVQT